MFYCDACAKEKRYPETLFKSRGNCEICGKTTICNEKSSKYLPYPDDAKESGIRYMWDNYQDEKAKEWLLKKGLSLEKPVVTDGD